MQGEKDVEAKQNSTNQSLGFKSMHARGRISWADEPDSEGSAKALQWGDSLVTTKPGKGFAAQARTSL
ncbi:hypothetical protein ACJBU6_09282 [Exserohilum turcicum]